jgi:hypothetical protein
MRVRVNMMIENKPAHKLCIKTCYYETFRIKNSGVKP